MSEVCRSTRRLKFLRAATLGVSLLALAACGGNGLDLDLRPSGLDTSDAARQATVNRPRPDARGVITYPNFQVAVARRGDTLSSLATRVGAQPAVLAEHNGLELDTKLRRGEVIALPQELRGTGAPGGGTGLPASESIDITTLAGNALDRADAGAGATPGTVAPAPVQAGPEPVQHQVVRGETAYSIARLYNVSVRSLSDWNGLGSDLTVREGQYLLIPVTKQPAGAGTAAPALAAGAAGAGTAASTATSSTDAPVVASLPAPAPVETTTVPGQGSIAPEPPSASTPLPEPDPEPVAAEVPKPTVDLGQERTSASATRLSMPVQGAVIRDYAKGSNEGIDIAASAGTPVKAAAGGTVAAITLDTDGVPILVIRHADNLLTVYANIDDVAIAKGDTVSSGQAVAKVRDNGQGLLHFQVRKGYDSVDPIDYLN